ncbi:MAG: SBBP repeat-containing protein, partial [Gammaproteobacteria bacterium]|nr:SBBP repeat-containing protein [Gammaproteobacteria bacterium]
MQGQHPALLCCIARKFLHRFFLTLLAVTFSLNSYSDDTIYNTYIGGPLYEASVDSTLDSDGNVYITGQTYSSEFQGLTTNFSTSAQDQNCFVTRINSASPNVAQVHIFGGSKGEVCRRIVVDAAKNIYVIGETRSPDLPVSNGTALAGDWDGFIFKFDNNFNILFGSYIGGSATDFAHGLALKTNGDILIAGETWSNDFPTTANAYINDCLVLDKCNASIASGFLLIFSGTKNQYNTVYATYLGGSHDDKAHAVASYGNKIVVIGETQSADFPLIAQLSDALKGNLDAFVSVFEYPS